MDYRSLNQRVFLYCSALLLFIAILQIALGLEKHLRVGLFDFNIYHEYGKILLRGQSPYDPVFTKGIPFNYPPSSFLLFAPLSLLPVLTATLVFTGFSTLFFILTVYHFLKQYFISTPVRLLVLALLLQNFPTKFTLVLGQVNLIVLALLLLSFYFDQKKSPAAAGLFWGMASSLKLTPLTLAVYFILRKKYSSLWIGITTFLITNLFFLVINPKLFSYLSAHLPTLLTKSGSVTTLYDQSLRAFFARMGTENNIFPEIIIILLSILACGKYLKSKSQLKDLTLLSQILLITTVGNSFAWQHHFVLTFPAFIAASKIAIQKKSWLYFSLLLFSALLVGYHIPNIAHPISTNPFFVSHTLIGAIILFFVLLYS